MRSSQARLFLIVTAVAFVVRAAQVVAMSDPGLNPLWLHPIMDARMHDLWARGILAGTWPGPEPFFRAPLYIYFLAGLYRLFGPDSRLAVQLVHALVSAAGAGLVALCAARVLDRRSGWAAGLLLAFLWTSIYFSGELLIVSLIVTLDLLLLWLLLAPPDGASPSRGRLLGAGLVWGLSAIARPNILILGPVLLWYLHAHRGLAWRSPRWALLALGLALPILPVTAHNVLRGHDAVLISSQGGLNFYIGNHRLSDGRTAVVPGTSPTWQGGLDDAMALASKEAGRPLSPSGADRHFLRKGLRFWVERPGWAALLYLRKLWLLVGEGERSNNKNVYFWRERSAVLHWPIWLGWTPILVLAVLGFWRRDLKAGSRFLLLGSVLAYAFSILLFFVNARFRLPVAAMLAIPAGGGLTRLVGAVRARRWPDRRAALLVAAIVLAVSVVPDRLTFREDRTEADVFSWHTLGNSYVTAGRDEEAVNAYRRCLAIQRRYHLGYFHWIEASVYTSLGDLLLKQGKTAEAARLFQDWVATNPSSVLAHVRLGDLLLRTGRADEAAAHFEIALRQAPDNYGARLGNAWILYTNGDWGAALRRFEALNREHEDVNALFGTGLSLIQLERFGEAERVFQRVLALQPDYWQALGNLAGLYEQTGRPELATSAYRRLLELRPDDQRARRWLSTHGR